jgi:3-oxoacyl-[acyl-carrier protein] reductase
MKLKDKIALLTAAAGAGIGQATARLLASEGANIVITDAHEGRARQVATSIAEEYHVESVGMACDVTSLDQV